MMGVLFVRQGPCTAAPVTALLIHVSDLTAAGTDTATMWLLTRRALIGLGLSLASLRHAAAAHGDDGAAHDHDRARRAVEHGEAMPLSDILARVRTELGGEVVGVAFRRKKDLWIYEFRVITPAGQLDEVYVDAATAHILKRETH
jgi:uncharacterized membrane protein YkoI